MVNLFGELPEMADVLRIACQKYVLRSDVMFEPMNSQYAQKDAKH